MGVYTCGQERKRKYQSADASATRTAYTLPQPFLSNFFRCAVEMDAEYQQMLMQAHGQRQRTDTTVPDKCVPFYLSVLLTN